ncbi:GrpB family protein [Streptomyces sp. NPDC012935]|uniref:GrpB family protein n=1 Tax=Streptomyces sp. NPDC012935 TaxID=3364857 RepID=UPI0036CB713F
MADLDEPIHVVAPDPAWGDQGRMLVQDISAALRGLSVDVAHIGSTAVPGLEAKPVIDVQIGCPAGEIEVAVARIERLGFECLGEAGVPGRQYLRRRSGLPANAHVVERKGRLWVDNLLFRDYLITHPDVMSRYAAAKREAARRAPTLLAYSDLKAQIVAEIMRAARGAAASGEAGAVRRRDARRPGEMLGAPERCSAPRTTAGTPSHSGRPATSPSATPGVDGHTDEHRHEGLARLMAHAQQAHRRRHRGAVLAPPATGRSVPAGPPF